MGQFMFSWERALKEIDLIDYFLYKFPEFYYDKKRKAYVDHPDPALRSSKVQFFKGKDGYTNFIAHPSGQGGNLISLIKNMVLQNQGDWKIGVNREIEEYLHMRLGGHRLKSTELQPHIVEQQSQEEFTARGRFSPLHPVQRAYLTGERMIGNKTINSKVFKGMMQSYIPEGKEYFVLASTILDQERNIVGVTTINTGKNYSDYGKKLIERNSQSSIGFTHSNFLPSAKRLIICESAIDAMSHYEMQQNTSEKVASHYMISNGMISANKAFYIQKEFEKNGYQNLILATDNDVAGYRFDLNILLAFLPNLKVDYQDTDFIAMSLTLDDNVDRVAVVSAINRFTAINESVTSFVDDILPADMARSFIEREKAILWIQKKAPNEFEFFIPNEKEYLKVFCESLSSCHLSLKSCVIFQKSEAKDWNENLKKYKNKKLKNNNKLTL